MPKLTISQTPDEMARLKQQAAAGSETPDHLASAAVRDYLARARADDAAWREELAAAITVIHQQLPPDISPDETEADITAAAAEVKEARRAARGGRQSFARS